MNYPKYLLEDIRWSFFFDPFDTQEEFEAELTDYYREVFEKNVPIKFNKKIFDHSEIAVQYMIYPEDEDDEEKEISFKLTANNDKYFTFGELLYKIHNRVCADLEHEDNHFFEGLQYAGDDDPDYPQVPFYFLLLGS